MAGCNGPDNTAGDGQTCHYSSAMTSCDSVGGYTTCWYCYVLDSLGKVGWLSGKFLSGQGLKVHEPAALADIGVGPGDFINKINGVLLSDEAALTSALAPFIQATPATVFSATHLLGKFQLSLSH